MLPPGSWAGLGVADEWEGLGDGGAGLTGQGVGGRRKIGAQRRGKAGSAPNMNYIEVMNGQNGSAPRGAAQRMPVRAMASSSAARQQAPWDVTAWGG